MIAYADDVKSRPFPWRYHAPLALAAGLASLAAMPLARASEFATGNPDLTIRWDNTVKYSAARRVKSPSPILTANPNLNDGDLNFNQGLISNRADLLSEFDLTYKQMGVRLSGAAWYDGVYNRSNDHPDDGTANQLSVRYNSFTDDTRTIHGRKAELLDAFVFSKFNLGNKPVTVRAGRHAQVWGESLFFGGNAIAGGMMPIDAVKLLSVPNTQFKEALRPVPMLSGQVQLTPDVAVAAYYQLRWQGHRLPAVGSYFSQVDLVREGGEQILLGLPTVARGGPFLQDNAPRVGDEKAANSGQGGLRVGIRHGETDYGLYAIRFHNKGPQQITNMGLRPVTGFIPGPGCTVPGSVQTGPASCALPGPVSYRLAYHEGIRAYGASASRTFNNVNLAAEVSIRHNQDLASMGVVDTSALGGSPVNNSSRPPYATGRTAHANLSALWSLRPSPLFREANFAGEVIWNRALKVQRNAALVPPNAKRDAFALRGVFEPVYRHVVPGLDLSVPVGLGYAPKGSRSMALGPGTPEGGGDINIGLNGTYLNTWILSLSYTHYYGKEQPVADAKGMLTYAQSLKDRNFVAFSVRRTF
jgi:hypothetical protein